MTLTACSCISVFKTSGEKFQNKKFLKKLKTYNRAKVLFLAHQTGALHILESFASMRSFSNKVHKNKNTKKTNFHV